MTPGNEIELSEAIRSADGPLRIKGGGTRTMGRSNSGVTLCTGDLCGASLYEPGALTLVVGAGTPLDEVVALLAAKGQRLAFEPMDHRPLLGTTGTPTIGGVVAGNISGPRRVQAGACRDFLLGVRFVDGAGRVVKNGGRVMKNVTGYDLVRLMAGSWGTLGVLSEVALKVLPDTEAQRTLVIEGLNDARAAQAMAKALGSPFEVTGAAHVTGARTLFRVEGFAHGLQPRAEKLARLLASFGQVHINEDQDKSQTIWREIRDVTAFCGQPGNVWRVSLKPSDGPLLGARLRDICDPGLIYDWGGGLVWALLPEGVDLRTHLHGMGGHARLERASDHDRKRFGTFQPETAPLATISAGLRLKFDPRAVLNPGLLGD